MSDAIPNFEQNILIPDLDRGQGAVPEMLGMARKYPTSHRENIFETLNKFHVGNTNEEWLKNQTKLTDNEYINLGTFIGKEKTLSTLNMTPKDLITLSKTEVRRGGLAKWFSGENPQAKAVTDLVDSLELRLFIDGQELTVGWQKTEESEVKKGWVLRTKVLTPEERNTMDTTMKSLEGLVPETQIFQNGQEALLASKFIPGENATADDMVLFRKKLQERGLMEEKFDLHTDNVIRTKDGQLLYVDSDYLTMK